MRRILIGLAAVALVISASVSFIHSVDAQSPGAPPGSAPPGGGPPGGRPPGGMMSAPVDSFVAERDSLMNDLLKHYAGRETAPAESVFKNLKVIKGVTVEQLLRRMNFGYGRSLGVRCQHQAGRARHDGDDRPHQQRAAPGDQEHQEREAGHQLHHLSSRRRASRPRPHGHRRARTRTRRSPLTRPDLA